MVSNEYNIDDKYTIVVEEQDTFQLELNKQGPQGERGPIGPVGPKGDKGEKGDQGIQGKVGPKGDTGVSVVGVEEISKVGLVTTYRMTFSNGEYFDYEVSDGSIDNLTREQVISLIGYEPASYTSVEDLTASRANISLNNLDDVGESRFNAKQDVLISSTNIKTINGESVLGSGNIEIKGGGSGLELCDICMALYVDETKGLRRRLNGQIVDINTNTQAFLNRLQEIITLHPSLLCTEEEWQTAKTMSAFGQVGKFVFNYSGGKIVSVRLPRVVNTQGLFDLQKLGMTVSAGLPNITGRAINVGHGDTGSTTGCFYDDKTGSAPGGYSSAGGTKPINLDASLSNPIYGNSDTVQPEAIQYPYFIQIATGSETENNIINEIELNNPFSLFDSKYSDHELNNLSWLKSEGQWNAKAVYPDAYDKLLKVQNGTETVEGLSVKLSTETYTDYDFVLNTADETFRLPLKTKLASGKAVVGNGMALGFDKTGLEGGGVGVQLNTPYTDTAYMKSKATFKVQTDPTKSGIELSDSGLYLYFYVGETVQNANLIDAGRIGEKLANKQDKLSRYPVEISDKSILPSWYMVYNDGWCEQGGNYNGGATSGTITLLKEYKDVKSFQIMTQCYFAASGYGYQIGVYNQSVNKFSWTASGSNYKFYWQASGYIK